VKDLERERADCQSRDHEEVRPRREPAMLWSDPEHGDEHARREHSESD